MTKVIIVAFDEQLDRLFGNEALDISTDITVLETMLKREGLISAMDKTTICDDINFKYEEYI